MASIELKVNYHSSRRYTLSRRDGGTGAFSDVKGHHTFGNDDQASFYRAVARLIADLANEGHTVAYDDLPD